MKVLVAFLLVAVASASCSTLRPVNEDVDLVPDNIITNGYTAPQGKAPYIVFLAFRNGNVGSWCGGSIIGSTWVVTASHCSKPYNSVTVYYGSNTRAQGEITHTVTGNNIINHPSDDIALIRTPPVTFNARINRVLLPPRSPENRYENTPTTACGWGRTTTTSTPQNLQCVDSHVISNAQCARTYGTGIVQNQILCTNTSGGRSICSGDSGGPLVTQSNTILIGISQFVSARGCTSGDPAGFARVTSHLEWIRRHTGIAT